jgi:glycosyltransferase involved in cell wall biosynthesis
MLAYHNLLHEGGYRVRVLSALRELASRPLPGGASVKFYLIGFEGIRSFFSVKRRAMLQRDIEGTAARVLLFPTLPEKHPMIQMMNLRIAGVLMGLIGLALRMRVVHAHSTLAAFTAGVGKPIGRYRILFDAHGADVEERIMSGIISRESWIHRMYLRTERMAVARADHVVCVSTALRRYLKPAAQASVVPCCVAAPLSDEDVARRREQARQRLRLDGRRVIGYLGSAAAWQQADATVEAFSQVARAVPEAHLLLLTPDVAVFEKLLAANQVPASRVTRLCLDHSEVPDYLPAMDVGVLLAGGVPVLITGVLEDFARLVRSEGVGVVWRAPRPDAQELQELVCFLEKAVENRQSLAIRCCEAVRSRLTWKQGGETYRRCYAELLQNGVAQGWGGGAA